MKRSLVAAALAAVALGAVLAPTPALAWHPHARVGVYFGGPAFGFGYPYPYWGGYPYYPYYSAPAVVAVPTAPPVYIEQPRAAPAAAPSQQAGAGYWYYCHNPAGYYPTVKACPAGWQRVAPLPEQ